MTADDVAVAITAGRALGVTVDTVAVSSLMAYEMWGGETAMQEWAEAHGVRVRISNTCEWHTLYLYADEEKGCLS